MSATKQVTSILTNLSRLVSVSWKAIKNIVFVLMVVLFIASHLFSGLAEATAYVIETVFQTPTALTEARTKQQIAAQELETSEKKLKSAQADLVATEKNVSRLEAKSAQLRTEIDTLQKQNKTLNQRSVVDFKDKKVALEDAVRTTIVGVQARTKKVATANLASAAGESIPFYGIAIIVAATTYELKSACDTMRDLHDLQVAMNPKSASDEEVKIVCGLKVRSKEELWEMVKSSPIVVWESAVTTLGESVEWVKNLETPDFSGAWSRSIVWFSSWFE